MITEEFEKMMKDLPGAKKAHQGFIIEKDGASFYVQGILRPEDREGLTNSETFFLPFCSKKEILRLREIKNAHDYLLKIRTDAIVDASRSVRVMRQRRTNYEAKGTPWHLAHYYHTLDHYHKDYIKKLSKQHKKVVMQVPAGLALINITNALCIKSLVGNIVIASENMIHFCYFMKIGCFGHYYGMSEADCSVALTIAIRIILGNESLDFDLDPRCILDKKLN